MSSLIERLDMIQLLTARATQTGRAAGRQALIARILAP
jgi:hypothetical protein